MLSLLLFLFVSFTIMGKKLTRMKDNVEEPVFEDFTNLDNLPKDESKMLPSLILRLNNLK